MPINPSIPRNLSFRAESTFVGKNNRVGRLRCDANGVYSGLPMMTLGETTQQNTYYDPQSVMDQITSPTSRFNIVLKQGKLLGEYGHPSFIGQGFANDSEKIQRLTTVDEKTTSHLFTSFYTDSPSRDGTVVLRADLKPTGPYGAVFKESLEDPVVNTAFSLRAYVDTKVESNGRKYRNVRSLVTFDTVGASGFFGSDKAHALGLESFAGDQFLDCEMTVMENGNLKIDQIALESISNSELNEIFGTSDIHRIIQSTTIVTPDPSLSQRFPNLYRKSIFNDFFKEI
jgi:hypothetical protein